MDDVTLEIDGHTVEVMDGPYLQDGEPSGAARAFAAELIGRLDEMRAFAAAGALLGLYNDTWRQDGDPVLDREEFASRLVDPSIVLFERIGSAAVYFEPSGLFSDHFIEISIDDGEIESADLAG